MAMRQGQKNNVLVGLFVVLSVVAFVLISFVLAGAGQWLESRTNYIVQLPLEVGAAGLMEGSQVTLGGHSIGSVSKVVISDDMQAIKVSIGIRSDITLHQGTQAFLELPLLGSISSLNFSSAGDLDAPPIKEGDVLKGTLAPPAFLKSAGYGPNEASKVRSIIEQTQAATRKIDELMAQIREDYQPVSQDVTRIASNIQDITEGARDDYPRWASDIDSIVADTKKTSLRFQEMIIKSDETLDSFSQGVEEARAIINSDKITSIIDHVDSSIARIHDEFLDEIAATLANARTGTEDYAKVGELVNRTINEELPAIRTSLANARLASDQLKLTTVEVRRNPWRLLYRPKNKELESELLYDATRNYAQAASDLRFASESLESVLNMGEARVMAVQPTVEELSAQLSESFKKYEKAEQKLLQIIMDGKP